MGKPPASAHISVTGAQRPGNLKLVLAATAGAKCAAGFQKGEAAVLVCETRRCGAEDLIEDDLTHQPGGDARAQAPSHGIP